jgi:spermidine synthase
LNRADDVRRRWASQMLMVASGFAGLGYQIIWAQQGSLWLGHEAAAVLAVVTAFFGGLAVGALVFGSRIERSKRPVRWYAGCELVVALWSLVWMFVGSPLSGAMMRVTGVAPSPGWQWTVAFSGTFVLFLPATAAMGATLPAMERLTTEMRGEGRSIAALYASNTFGAVLGVIATAFWLIPSIGLARSAAACIALNLLCAFTALAMFPKTAAPAPKAPALDRGRARAVLARLALTGLFGIGYEVLVVRVLSQVTEATVYTFAMLLAVYLVGTAAGAAGYDRRLGARGDRDVLGDRLFAALGSACLAGTASLWASGAVKTWALQIWGGGMTAAVAVEALLAVLAFGPPTLVMGALFSHLSRTANEAGVSFGRALGANMLPAAAAPIVFGVLAGPALGPKVALLLVVAGYLASTARRAWATPFVWAPAVVALAALLFAPPLVFVEIPEGGHVVRYEEGVMAAVSVVEDADGVARLRINDRQQEGSSATLHVDGRQAWLPLLLHPAPRRALFLGLGTGVTASSAAEDPTLGVDAVELLPEVITASTHFTRRFAGGTADRLHVLAADARRYVRASDRRYDVIVSDNFHPARSGSGALYTVEHFEAVHLRLETGGLFCQWLPLHQLDVETLRSIVRSFTKVYPQGWAVIASNSLETPVLGLVARAGEDRFDMAEVQGRFSHLALPQSVASLGLEDAIAVLGSVVAGPAALRRFADDAPANTDDHPVVAYRAPRITYAPDSTPRDRLIALLRELSVNTDELLAPTPDPAFSLRLVAYWRARDRFIISGRDVRPSPRVEEMLAQVREPLLSILRISPDFRPAYDPLSDVSGARALLTELTQIQPARAEATRLLTSMSEGANVDNTHR